MDGAANQKIFAVSEVIDFREHGTSYSSQETATSDPISAHMLKLMDSSRNIFFCSTLNLCYIILLRSGRVDTFP